MDKPFVKPADSQNCKDIVSAVQDIEKKMPALSSPFEVIGKQGTKADAFENLLGAEDQQVDLKVMCAMMSKNYREVEQKIRKDRLQRVAFLMFSGAQGTGKTAHAKALASFLGIPCVSINPGNATQVNSAGQTAIRQVVEYCLRRGSAVVLCGRERIHGRSDSHRNHSNNHLGNSYRSNYLNDNIDSYRHLHLKHTLNSFGNYNKQLALDQPNNKRHRDSFSHYDGKHNSLSDHEYFRHDHLDRRLRDDNPLKHGHSHRTYSNSHHDPEHNSFSDEAACRRGISN